MKIISTVVILLYSFANLCAQTYSFEDREILELQDRRELGENDKLISYLLSINSGTRVKAINALANIGDSAAVSKLNFLLAGPFENYPTLNDLIASAFMLGQIPSEESRQMTVLMLNNKTDSLIESKKYFVDALGRTGDEQNLETLISRYFFYDNEISAYLAMSIGRFALRRIKNQKSVNALKDLSGKANDAAVKRNTAFAFWRTGDKNLLDSAKQEIYNLVESEDAQTRMWGVNAMGKLKDKILLHYILSSFDSEEDWRVKVNMLNSLTNFSMDSIKDMQNLIINVLGGYSEGESEHISVTRLNVLGKLFDGKKFSDSDDVRDGLIEILNDKKYTYRIRSEAANALSLIFKDDVRKDLMKAFANAGDYNTKAGIIKAFGNFKSGKVFLEVRDSISAEVARYNKINSVTSGEMIQSSELAKLYRAFVEMLSNIYPSLNEKNQNTARLIFTEFAGSRDLLITDICLAALKDSVFAKYKDETAQVILFEYNQLSLPENYDLMLIFIDAMKDLNDDSTVKVLENNLNSENYEIAKASAEALEKIDGKKYQFSAKPRTDFDWDYLESLSQNKYVTINTNKGEIKIELLPEAAPFTVMNFLKLTEKKYFDGTVFHRVVPNFVIQGGDPTGTGYGGPGYSIRSEYSPLSYDRGMVGMASSGKDTEGSQFFITHSATPHLDGRYTIFGKVTDGMDVVDEIMAGDSIISVSR